MYTSMFGQMKKQLGQLQSWFDLAATQAKARSFDVEILLGMRLSPDQFSLARQVQIACDTAKLGASRVTGKAAPSNDDSEKTFEELRARVKSTIAFLDSIAEKDFEGVATRTVTQPRWEGKVMTAHDYFVEHVVPNFYFHLTHVYAILRHNGVPVGKRDYLGALSQRMPG